MAWSFTSFRVLWIQPRCHLCMTFSWLSVSMTLLCTPSPAYLFSFPQSTYHLLTYYIFAIFFFFGCTGSSLQCVGFSYGETCYNYWFSCDSVILKTWWVVNNMYWITEWCRNFKTYWSGVLCPPPEDLPNPGIKPKSQVGSLPLAPPGTPPTPPPYHNLG